MRFLGGKWQKKNDGDSKGNRMSRFALQGWTSANGGVADFLLCGEEAHTKQRQRAKADPPPAAKDDK